MGSRSVPQSWGLPPSVRPAQRLVAKASRLSREGRPTEPAVVVPRSELALLDWQFPDGCTPRRAAPPQSALSEFQARVGTVDEISCALLLTLQYRGTRNTCVKFENFMVK